jgi:hypothetical protein
MTPAERAQNGRLGAYVSWGNTPDRAKRTAPGRRAADARFDRMVIEKHGVLPPEEHAKCAAALRSAHYAEMALKSVRSRKRKRAEQQ